MRIFRRLAVAAALGALTVGGAAGAAGAAPTGSKNAFVFPATCNGQDVTLVVNSANGQGQGTNNNVKGQANFAPAHVVGTHEVLLPLSLDLQFTITSGGQTFTFPLVASHGSSTGSTTCVINSTQTDPASGDTFTIAGTASGRLVGG